MKQLFIKLVWKPILLPIRELYMKELLEDKEEGMKGIYNTIMSNGAVTIITFTMLILSSLCACIGLHQNDSNSVILSMLISPLMAALLYIALTLSKRKFNIFYIGILLFITQSVVAVILSWGFFSVYTLFEPTQELIGRIKPSIFNVYIGAIGAIGAVIGNFLVHKNKSGMSTGAIIFAAIGIGTALVPPLCAIGYGLASGNDQFIYEPLDLYGINVITIIFVTWILLWITGYTPIRNSKKNPVVSRVKSYIMVISFIGVASTFAIYAIPRFAQFNDDRIIVNHVNSTLQEKTYGLAKNLNINHKLRKISFDLQTTPHEHNIENPSFMIDSILRSHNLIGDTYQIDIFASPSPGSYFALNSRQKNTDEIVIDLQREMREMKNAFLASQEEAQYYSAIREAKKRAKERFTTRIGLAKGIEYVNSDFVNEDPECLDVDIMIKKRYSSERYVKTLRDSLDVDSTLYSYQLKFL